MALGMLALGAGMGLASGGMGLLPGSSAKRQKEAQGRYQEFLAGMDPSDFLAPGLQSDTRQRQLLSQQLGGRGVANYRPEMQQYIAGLRSDVAGNGPGQELVRRQVGQQTQSGIQNQLAMMAGQRGNPLAARTAATQMGQISGQGGQAAAMGGLQAQLAARGQLGQALGQERALSQRGQLEALRQQQLFRQMQQGGRQAFMGAQMSGRGSLAGMKQAPGGAELLGAGLLGGAEMFAGASRSRGGGGFDPYSGGGDSGLPDASWERSWR